MATVAEQFLDGIQDLELTPARPSSRIRLLRSSLAVARSMRQVDGAAGTPRASAEPPPPHRWNSPDSKTPPSASGAMRSSKPRVKACRSSEAFVQIRPCR